MPPPPRWSPQSPPSASSASSSSKRNRRLIALGRRSLGARAPKKLRRGREAAEARRCALQVLRHARARLRPPSAHPAARYSSEAASDAAAVNSGIVRARADAGAGAGAVAGARREVHASADFFPSLLLFTLRLANAAEPRRTSAADFEIFFCASTLTRAFFFVLLLFAVGSC